MATKSTVCSAQLFKLLSFFYLATKAGAPLNKCPFSSQLDSRKNNIQTHNTFFDQSSEL